MRTARKKVIGEDTYYHLCSRVAGSKGHYPFTRADKQAGIRIVKELCEYFCVEPISVAWMGNHWHLVLFVPGTPPSREEAAGRYNAHYGKKGRYLDPDDTALCDLVRHQLTDISQFMRQVQQKFTWYINKTHNRRGTLWAERFKSTILEEEEALWNCVAYIELNPVRAGLVKNPGQYRHSTWGHYCGTGKHLFGDNFTRHLRAYLGEEAAAWSDDEVCIKFSELMERIIAAERTAKGRPDFHPDICLLRKTRYWTHGMIIGSHSFVKRIANMLGQVDIKLKSGITGTATTLHCSCRFRESHP